MAALRGLHAAARDVADHGRRVADRVQVLYPGCPPGVVEVARHHQALEARSATPDGLRRAGLSERSIEAIVALTRFDRESDEAYFSRVRTNPWALMVAHADAVVSADAAALADLGPDDRARFEADLDRTFRALDLES